MRLDSDAAASDNRIGHTACSAEPSPSRYGAAASRIAFAGSRTQRLGNNQGTSLTYSADRSVAGTVKFTPGGQHGKTTCKI
jgi:hypothetical protein